MNRRFFAVLLGLVVVCAASAASATNLMFKSNQGEYNKGVVQRIDMYPLTSTTVRLDVMVGTYTGNGNYCTVSSISTTQAMDLISAFTTGKMVNFWCRTTTPTAGSATVDNLNYFITMGQ